MMKNTNIYLLLTLILGFNGMLYAQSTEGVAISSSANVPDPSAMLDIQSSNKGLLVPRVAINDVNNQAPVPVNVIPEEGLLVYNLTGTEPKGFYYWTSTKWYCMSCCSVSLDEPWKIIGSDDILSNGKQVPEFVIYNGEPLCFSQAQPQTSGGSLPKQLSIRKLANGKIHLKGEFILNCNVDEEEQKNPCNLIFDHIALQGGYEPQGNIQIMSPILVNGQPQDQGTIHFEVNICPIPNYESSYNGITADVEFASYDFNNAFPVGSVVYIDIQYDPM